jgi:hypothetical protein
MSVSRRSLTKVNIVLCSENDITLLQNISKRAILSPMGVVKKISFPYLVKSYNPNLSPEQRLVVFFGTSFVGSSSLPGWDQALFVERTNQMLDYIRSNFKGRQLLYQPHPNETTEIELFNLDGFTVGDKVIAELFLYDKAEQIEFTFSACSGASISAYAMGLNAAVFLDTLTGAITKWDLLAYRSYFAGLPESFFIKSFAQSVPEQSARLALFDDATATIRQAFTGAPMVWLLASEPGVLIKAITLARILRQVNPGQKISLIKMNNRRWEIISTSSGLLSVFDRVVELTHPSVRFSARLPMVLAAFRSAQAIKKLPIGPNDAIVSFPYTLFEENCLQSYFPTAKKILMLENRWYNFTYEDGSKDFEIKKFNRSKGVLFFNYFLEPLLGLHRTIFLDYPGCNVLNKLRYVEPLEKVYDTTLILMP